MSELLGRQDCIESLRKDLVDLQGAILDVFSRTGPVRFPSWKFPDKLSCNLDMVALLGQYDFMDGEDSFNQHSHIVLLELMIDRLLLLLQSFNSYVGQLRSSHRTEQPQQKGCLSVGLVVRHYWSNLVLIKDNFKDIRKQKNPKTFDCDESETVSSVYPQMNSRVDSCRHCSSAKTLTSSNMFLPQNHVPSSPTHNTLCHTNTDSYNVSCQTVESSLIPCIACLRAQSVLRKTGGALVSLFQSEGLPSSLQPLLLAVEDTLELGHMTAGDVAQWANEQLRDMRRLAKHLQDVRGTVDPLKDRLAAAEADQERFKSQLERALKEFKQETEKYQVTIVQLEFSLQKTQRSIKETKQRLQEEQQQLKTETLSLEESNSRLKEKVAVQQDTLQALECQKTALWEKVESLHLKEEACCILQQRIEQLESQVSETQVLLDKENAKYHSACRQQESMQAKQKSLLKRVDVLDKECEELQRQLGDREERLTELHNELQQMSEEKEQLRTQLAHHQDLCLKLKEEKQSLETNIGELNNSVDELKECVQTSEEKERLLVAFPELSPQAQAQPQSTGNVLLDMKQQLQANSIRIKVLDQENAILHNSIEKLGERAQYNAAREAWPQQTRSPFIPNTPVKIQENHLKGMQNSQLQGSSAGQLGYSNGRKDARGGESGCESVRSEDRVSTATASPSSLKIHLQTLQLNAHCSSAAKSCTGTRSVSLHPHSRGFKQRGK